MASSTFGSQISQQVMDYVLKGVAMPSMPSSLWIALFTTAPGISGTGGTEVSTAGTGYARVEMPRITDTWNGPTGSLQEYNNSKELVFPIPTANWGTVVALGLYDAQTAGNLIFVTQIGSSRAISLGDGAPRIPVSEYKVLRASC